ncbi:AP2 domain-containing protein [Bacillus vallismortis]|uniref:AP2 domain-containing protein n=1 Tax=Bacillus vallismortis TaxID=72361 RepID=UPI0002896BFD|nr:AP2 domain-containing protein [Bacillus vallismortis]QAV07442.1 hypothetical protein BV11031_01850 [Bacillus vallismortis]
MKNDYEIRGEITAIFLIGKHGFLETIIDTADLQKAKEFNGYWHPLLDKKTDSFYVGGSYKKGNGNWASIRLHRWLMNPSDDQVVDHRNHDTLDNRRANLRLCSIGENNRNRKYSKHNTSEYKGVGWHKTNGRYRARIKFNGKSIHLGYFKTEIEAAEAYNKAAIKFHGEFAEINKLIQK